MALKEQEAEKLARREERVLKLLDAAVQHYARATELFTAWLASRAKGAAEVEVVLKGKPEAQQLEYLRKQIEMRVLGCGWTQYATRWSSSSDVRIGTVTHLKALLLEIIVEEKSLTRLQQLPIEAAPPHHQMRDLGQLGTADADALALEQRSLFSADELHAKMEKEVQRRLEAGISDPVEDMCGDLPPAFDQQLVGKRIEVLWRYFNKDTKEPQLIWATGRVAKVADGKTGTSGPSCARRFCLRVRCSGRGTQTLTSTRRRVSNGFCCCQRSGRCSRCTVGDGTHASLEPRRGPGQRLGRRILRGICLGRGLGSLRRVWLFCMLALGSCCA